MTTRNRTIIFFLLVLGIVISLLGGIAIFNERQVRLRGAISGVPPQSMPYRLSGLGVNVDLTQYNPAELDANLDQIKKAGFIWVRQVFDWSVIEDNRGHFDWSKYDAVVDAASSRDLRIVAVLWRTPGWAGPDLTAPPADMAHFETFARLVAEHYGDRIDVYQIWDEPNLSAGWGNQPPDPIMYAEMLQKAYVAIHNADQTAIVLTAGLAPTVETGPENLSDILFLRSLYDNDAAVFFDGVAGKPYGYDTSPEDRRVDPNILNFSHFILLREEMERHGDGGKLLWATQFGWNSLPEGWQGRESVWGQVNAQQQTKWTVGAYQRALLEWPWSGPMFLENWQPATSSDDPRWGFALKDESGQMTDLARALAKNAKGYTASLWPGRYPADTPLASYSGEWEFSDLGADLGQKNDSVVELPFSGSSFAVLARRDNYRAYLYVSVNGQPSPALPQDKRGAYQILTSPDYKPHTDTLLLADGYTPDQPHTIRIEGDRGWDQWTIAGYAVGYTIDTTPYDALMASLALMALVMVVVAGRLARTLPFWNVLAGWSVWLSTRLSEGMHIFLSLAAGVAVWLGMALTWGGFVPGTLQRAGEVPSLIITALTAGVFYFSPSLILTLFALVALFVLIYARPSVGLALMMAFTPYYLLPRPLFDRAFSVLEVITLLTLAAWALLMLAERRSKGWSSLPELWQRMTLLDKAVAGFVLMASLSLIWAELKGVAATELRQMVLEPVTMYLVLRTMRFPEQERAWIVHLLVLTGTVVAVYGFYQFAVDWVKSPGQFTCLRSTFGTCNNAALYLGRLIPICAAVTLVSRDRSRWLYTAAGVLMLAAAVLTVSRGGLLFGIPAALALVIILWGGRRGVMVVVAGLVLELLILIPLVTYVPRFRDMLDLSSGSSSSFFRTQVWQSTFRMLQDHPITGVGLDQFLYLYRGHYIMPDAWQQPDLSQPHNFILNYWVRLGIVGLGIAILMHYAFWRLALKTLSRLKEDRASRALVIGLLGGMANMVAHGMVDETHFVIDLAFIFFMSLGLVTQLQPASDEMVTPV